MSASRVSALITVACAASACFMPARSNPGAHTVAYAVDGILVAAGGGLAINAADTDCASSDCYLQRDMEREVGVALLAAGVLGLIVNLTMEDVATARPSAAHP